MRPQVFWKIRSSAFVPGYRGCHRRIYRSMEENHLCRLTGSTARSPDVEPPLRETMIITMGHHFLQNFGTDRRSA
jgi:hypothetical protein